MTQTQAAVAMVFVGLFVVIPLVERWERGRKHE